MRLSRYFVPTLRENPAHAQVVSHRLMLRAGMIQQITSGIYAWLPLGLRVLERIAAIVRKEQEAIGAIEMLLPVIQPADLWEKSGRYQDYGQEMLRIVDRHKRPLLFGPTAEEVMTEIFQTHVKSHQQVPLCLYNIQWKFRDEIRPRFGVMRGREFLMKDAYSFHVSFEDARSFYQKMFECYVKTFRRMGLQVVPVEADTGPIGGDLSHEFHILAQTGEDTLYYDPRIEEHSFSSYNDFQTVYAASEDKYDAQKCPIPEERLKKNRGIEVGHIFYFGTKYSKALGAMIKNPQGIDIPVEMGSYGIGISRLVAAVIEACHDEKGICWPESISPFYGILLNLGVHQQSCLQQGEVLYESLASHDILYDDRPLRSGEKFAQADLMGIPYQAILSPKTLSSQTVEVIRRRDGQKAFVPWDVFKEKTKEKTLNQLF